MIKLLKKLTKKDWLFVFISVLLIVFQVWLELKMPDYMSNITQLVQTKGADIKDILREGSYMLLCALGSLLSIKPILAVKDGLVVQKSQVRGKKQIFTT